MGGQTMTGKRIAVTIGVAAYNEEANIGALLQALRDQQTDVADVREILVVASGCTDRTADIVASMAEADPRITLILEDQRRGKATAINEILQRAKGEVLVLESADTIPSDETIERLVRRFSENQVGVVASRPIPVDDGTTLWAAVAHTLWELHHHVSLQVPKPGELFAFRHILEAIPAEVGADEDWIRAEVEGRGYQVLYEPRAVVYNAGPKTFAEFVRQRARVNIQEVFQRRQSAFVVPTWKMSVLLRAVGAYLHGGGRVTPFLLLSFWELVIRAYALLRVAVNPLDVSVWEELPSTKKVPVGRVVEPETKPKIRARL